MKKYPLYISGLVISFMCSACHGALSVSAAPVGITGGATVTGELTDQLILTADNLHFFEADLMGPGDAWDSVITMQNTGEEDIRITLEEIENRLDELKILEVLRLRLSVHDTLLYEGPYAAAGRPVIPWIILRGGQELALSIHISFPEECGNEYQSASYKTVWRFLAMAGEKDPAPTEVPSATKPPVTPVITAKPEITAPVTQAPGEQVTPAPSVRDNTVDFPLLSGTPVPSPGAGTGIPPASGGSSAMTHDPGSGAGSNGTQMASSVKTGDDTPLLEYAVITLLAFADAAGLLYILKKKRKGSRRK